MVDQPDPDGTEYGFKGSDKGCYGGGEKSCSGCEHRQTQAKIDGAKGDEQSK